MKDGWHVVNNENVFVEDDKIIRGEHYGRSTYPYKQTKTGAWENAVGVRVSTYRRGKYQML